MHTCYNVNVISILKKSHKNLKSMNPGLKVDQIFLYIAASPDLLVTCHCCRLPTQ